MHVILVRLFEGSYVILGYVEGSAGSLNDARPSYEMLVVIAL